MEPGVQRASVVSGWIQVNGTPRVLGPGASVKIVVDEVAAMPRGVAVALNGEVVPRGAWAETVLRDGDRVEILSVAPGG